MTAGCVFCNVELSIITLSRLIPVFKERQRVDFINKKKKERERERELAIIINITVDHQTQLFFLSTNVTQRTPAGINLCPPPKKINSLTFRHHASCILGQAFHYSPENAFYIFNQHIYFIIWYLLDRASLI